MGAGKDGGVNNTNLVVEACAIMWPPIGFLGSVANMEAPSTWATTWLVITTATPNCERERSEEYEHDNMQNDDQ